MTVNRNWQWGLVALTGVAIIAVLSRREGDQAEPAPAQEVASEKGEPAAATPPPEPVLMPVAKELSDALIRPEGSPEEELQTVGQLLHFYRQGFGENPVGQNEDVVSALTGENQHRAAYLPKDSPSIVDGKLVDRWGSPYWFHPVSGREMEIRSAGPDRELFTTDDLFEP